MKPENFLSIGEVAKIANINIKSLRYYDQIGVLKPAYVDEDSGYRYYEPSQLSILQAILMCIELGIPLKEFKTYFTDDHINVEKLIRDARAIADQKIQSIIQVLNFTQRMLETLERNDRFCSLDTLITCPLTARQYATLPIVWTGDGFDVHNVLGRLQLAAIRAGYQTGCCDGLMFIWRRATGLWEYYVFTEIFGSGDDQLPSIRIPAQNCSTIFTETSSKIEQAETIFCDLFQNPACGDLVITQSEVIGSTYDFSKREYELRCMQLTAG